LTPDAKHKRHSPELFTMRNEEFDIVRDLIAGRGPKPAQPTYSGHSIAPASFREIDGQELARQYVAYRKLRESEALAEQTGAEKPDAALMGVLRGERRLSEAADALSESPPPGNWFSALARSLWRR
jgi:hypothetical protein